MTYSYPTKLAPATLPWDTSKGWWGHDFGLENYGIGHLYVCVNKVDLAGAPAAGGANMSLNLWENEGPSDEAGHLLVVGENAQDTKDGGPPFDPGNHKTCQDTEPWLGESNLQFDWCGLAGKKRDGKYIAEFEDTNGNTYGGGIVMPGDYVLTAECSAWSDPFGEPKEGTAEKASGGAMGSSNKFVVKLEFKIASQVVDSNSENYNPA